MTYLELVNAVLTRLREDTIDGNPSNPANFLKDPYYKSIGEHVNDAKDRVEDAWQWTQLRVTDTVEVDNTGSDDDGYVEIPESFDNAYNLTRVWNRTTGGFFRARSESWMRQYYAGLGPTPYDPAVVDSYRGTPTYWGWARENPASSGNRTLIVAPIPNGPYQLAIDGIKHQPRLALPTDVLKVPSLPVYTLATALASRERGEVGGTPTSELFAIADSHLSDAIAQDTAWVADEMDWFSDQLMWHNTNVRTA